MKEDLIVKNKVTQNKLQARFRVERIFQFMSIHEKRKRRPYFFIMFFSYGLASSLWDRFSKINDMNLFLTLLALLLSLMLISIVLSNMCQRLNDLNMKKSRHVTLFVISTIILTMLSIILQENEVENTVFNLILLFASIPSMIYSFYLYFVLFFKKGVLSSK